MEFQIFNVLDRLRPTATGLDNLLAWFLQVDAPLFAAPVADLMNLSLDMSVVPTQWKRASILPIPKVNTPVSPSDFRPISITPILSRLLERIVTREHIYPSLKHAPPFLDFSDQFAFQPTGATTAALISLLHTITSMLETKQYVIVYAIDFSKAFDSVRHSTLMEKFALLCLPDNIYNWIGSFFSKHSHITSFRGKTSSVKSILVSIIQGSAIGPASYVVTASDLHAHDPVNKIKKYADDTYLLIPASNVQSCADEIQHIEDWAMKNNLTMNRKKSVEIVISAPRGRRKIVIPSPAVPSFERVESMRVLGVTVNNKLSFSDHVEDMLAKCSRTLFALKTLRSHGMPDSALQNVFQSNGPGQAELRFLCLVGLHECVRSRTY